MLQLARTLRLVVHMRAMKNMQKTCKKWKKNQISSKNRWSKSILWGGVSFSHLPYDLRFIPQISGFSWNFKGLNVVIRTSFRRYECRFSANQPFKFHWKCYLWQKHENFKGWMSSFHSFWINFHDLHENLKVWSSSYFWKFMNLAR